jgi:hypothetical protein
MSSALNFMSQVAVVGHTTVLFVTLLCVLLFPQEILNGGVDICKEAGIPLAGIYLLISYS